MKSESEGEQDSGTYSERANKFANKVLFSNEDSHIGLMMAQPHFQNNPELFTNPKEKIRLATQFKQVQYAATLFCNNLNYLYSSTRKPQQPA